MERTDDHDQIFLQMQLGKSLQRDATGNVIFEVEASNENLDIEGQRVLQRALLQTKDYFLKNGVVSKDHKHREFHENGSFDVHEDYVIGEPIDVYAKGTSVMVKGKLYANNEYAKKFINLLEQGSSRVRASVGGLVPRIKKTIDNGRKIGEIVSVLWDDLALTVYPVNPTVNPATSMAKSLSSVEFVKTLSAGYGTDSASFTGGRALQKEDVENEKILSSVNDKAIASLVGAMADGDITGLDEAESFLVNFGISKADAREIVRAVCKKSNSFMEVFPMAKKAGTLWDEIKAGLKKSISGKRPEDDDEPNPLNPDGSDGDDDDDDEDEYEDVTEVVKALTEKVIDLEENINVMVKAQTALLEKLEATETMQKSLGQGILAIMERTEEVIAAPAPRKGAVTQLEAALVKSLTGKGGAMPGGTGGRLKPFNAKTFDVAKDILIKAVSDGEIDTATCAGYETQINKSLKNASFAFSDDFVAFMKKHVAE